MLCESVKKAILDSRYAGIELEPAQKQHLSECEKCRAFVAQNEQLERFLSLDQDLEPGPGFDTCFFARLEEIKQDRRSGAERGQMGWLLRLGWLFAVSLPLAVAAVAVVWVLQKPLPAPSALVEPEMEQELGLILDLELVQEMELLQQLDEIEAYEVLAQLEMPELEQIIGENAPVTEEEP